MSALKAVEFRVQLSGEAVLRLPDEIARELPRSGEARVILLTESEPERWLALAEPALAEPALARAYGDAEPDYSRADLKH